MLRLLAAGRPTLVSAADTFLELPDAVCPKVDPDRSEAALIYHYAHLLQTTPALATALGHNARTFVAREHSLPQAAHSYMRFLAQLNGWSMPEPTRPPLWSVLPEPYYAAGSRGTGVAAPASLPVGDPSLAGIGDALAALGVTADDDAALADVASIVTGLLT